MAGECGRFPRIVTVVDEGVHRVDDPVDGLHERPAGDGHPDARPVHGFAMRAVVPTGAPRIDAPGWMAP